MKIVQGGVYWAYLDPARGSEQRGRRPVIVVSPNEIQDYLKRSIVVPVTTQDKGYPTFQPVMIRSKKHYAMLDQLRTLDHTRIKSEIEHLTPQDLKSFLRNVRELFEQ